ncbi:MAG: metallopeptidase TldD-related protein [Anaerolineae bacterium]
MATLHEKALALVDGHPQVQDWAVRTFRRRSLERYLVREQVESQRMVETERAVVEVHRDLHSPEGEPRRGFSSFTLLPDDDTSAGRQKLEEAIFAAGLALNPTYELPGPARYPEVLTLDPELVRSPGEALAELSAQLLRQLKREPQVELSSAEFFAHVLETQLANSRGVETRKEETHLVVELVLLSSDGHEESEYFASLQRRALRDLDLATEIARGAARARDSLRAGVPPTRTGPVAISGRALLDLLAFLRHATSGSMKYQHLSQWEMGQSVYGDKEVKGELLTLVTDRTLPWGIGTGPFDDDGVPGQRVALVEAGVLKRFWADYRHAQYLSIPPTGTFGNLVIPGGRTPAAELLNPADRLFHIVSFASMDPDPITGEFVGEIRLGYDVGAGETRPFKGGALSGNMEGALADVRFSQEQIFLGGYWGPEVALFGELAVGGN